MIHALTPQQQAEQASILASGSGHDAYVFAQHIQGANVRALYNRAVEAGGIEDEDLKDFEALADTADLLAEGASLRQSGAMLHLSREQLLALSKTQDPALQELASKAAAALNVTREECVIYALAKGHHEDGEIEFDDSAAISGTGPGGDNGAYVSAWFWVDFADTPLDKSRAECASDEAGEAEGDAP